MDSVKLVKEAGEFNLKDALTVTIKLKFLILKLKHVSAISFILSETFKEGAKNVMLQLVGTDLKKHVYVPKTLYSQKRVKNVNVLLQGQLTKMDTALIVQALSSGILSWMPVLAQKKPNMNMQTVAAMFVLKQKNTSSMVNAINVLRIILIVRKLVPWIPIQNRNVLEKHLTYMIDYAGNVLNLNLTTMTKSAISALKIKNISMMIAAISVITGNSNTVKLATPVLKVNTNMMMNAMIAQKNYTSITILAMSALNQNLSATMTNVINVLKIWNIGEVNANIAKKDCITMIMTVMPARKMSISMITSVSLAEKGNFTMITPAIIVLKDNFGITTLAILVLKMSSNMITPVIHALKDCTTGTKNVILANKDITIMIMLVIPVKKVFSSMIMDVTFVRKERSSGKMNVITA